MPTPQNNGSQAPLIPPPPSSVPQQAPLPPQQQPAGSGTSTGKVVGIVAGVVIALIITLWIVSAVAAGAAVTFGFASCAAEFTDAPVQDSPEDAAFIADPKVTQRDLEVYDALSGSFESICNNRVGSDSPVDKLAASDVAQLRAQLVEDGEWPKDPWDVGVVGSSRNPQTWVRLAELSQDRICAESGEDWEVVDFSYPFPDSGPIPVPATIDEDDYTMTRLVCTSGPDKGLYATVAYLRWQDPAVFGVHVDEARKNRDDHLRAVADIEESGLLEGYDWVLDAGDVVVWSTGEDDPLRDPEAFSQRARDLAELMGGSCRLTLVPGDFEPVLLYSTLGYDYPNVKPDITCTLDEAREQLANAPYVYSLSGTIPGALLTGWFNLESENDPYLDGSLAPTE